MTLLKHLSLDLVGCSQREREILDLLVKGYRYKEIAGALGISLIVSPRRFGTSGISSGR